MSLSPSKVWAPAVTNSCVYRSVCIVCVRPYAGAGMDPFYAAAAVCFVSLCVVTDSCFVAGDDFRSQADRQGAAAQPAEI